MEASDEWCFLGMVLFDINHIDIEIECKISKFANDMKLSGAVDKTEGWDAIQRNMDTLEKWAYKNLMTNDVLVSIPDMSTVWEKNSLRAALQRGLWGFCG